MISHLTAIVLLLFVTIPLVVAALLLVRDRQPRYAIAFLILFALDTTILLLPSALELHPGGLKWNWIGKFLGVAWAAVFIWVGPLSAEDVGGTLRHRLGTVQPAIKISGIVLIVTSVIMSTSNWFESSPPIVETLAYQATMPGLAEELVFRGVFLSLLILALGGAMHQDEFEWTQATIGAILITTIVFGLIHGVSPDGSFHLQIEEFVFSAILGGIFAWLRLYTGSLLFPILLHNAVNTLNILILFVQ